MPHYIEIVLMKILVKQIPKRRHIIEEGNKSKNVAYCWKGNIFDSITVIKYDTIYTVLLLTHFGCGEHTVFILSMKNNNNNNEMLFSLKIYCKYTYFIEDRYPKQHPRQKKICIFYQKSFHLVY